MGRGRACPGSTREVEAPRGLANPHGAGGGHARGAPFRGHARAALCRGPARARTVAMMRFGNPPRPGIAYVERPGAYAVIPRGDGRLLLTEQADPGPEIQLPGGGIDPGEGPLQAVIREAWEETGWRIRPLRRLGVYQRFTWMPEYRLHARKICHIYLCAAGLRGGPPAEAGHRALWLPVETAVRTLGSPGDAWFAANHAAGRL